MDSTLTFDVEAGRPVKLVWHQKHIHEPQETTGGKIPGFTEDWGLTRTYGK